LPGSGTATHVISQPGSYMLTANVVGQTGRNGIEISASHVTLDLNGFCLDGAGAGLNGILAVGALTNVRIRSGTAKNWTLVGIHLESADGLRLEDLCALNNGDDGFRVGNEVDIADFCANDNAGHGLNGKNDVRIEGGRAARNGANGILVLNLFLINNVVVKNNGNNGVEGGEKGGLRQVTSGENTNHGVQITTDGSARDALTFLNGVNGLVSGDRTHVSQYRSSDNGDRNYVGGDDGVYRNSSSHHTQTPGPGVGFDVQNGNLHDGCVATGGATQFIADENNFWKLCLAKEGASGFVGGNNCTARDCQSSGHIARSFQLGDSAEIRESRSVGDNSFGNLSEAGRVGSNSRVIASHVHNSGGGGFTTGDNCTVEDNLVTWDTFPIGQFPTAYSLGSHCTVRSNVADGGAFTTRGMNTGGVGNVIDRNVTTRGTVGLRVTDMNNVVTSHNSGGNLINYDLAPGIKAGTMTSDPSSPDNSYANVECP